MLKFNTHSLLYFPEVMADWTTLDPGNETLLYLLTYYIMNITKNTGELRNSWSSFWNATLVIAPSLR